MSTGKLVFQTPGKQGHSGGRAMPGLLAAGLLVATSTASAPAQSPTPHMMERAKSASVMIRTSHSKSSEGDTLIGTGSGFFVNSNGLCITNNHVVDPGHHKSQEEKFKLKMDMNRLVWEVVTRSGTPDEEKWRADVLYQNEQADLAVLQVKDQDGRFLEWEDYIGFLPTSQVTEGMKAWCLGFPGGDSAKNTQDFPKVAVTSGNVVDLPRTTSGRITMIETDVLANPGNSGGPFIDISGRLVGVLTLASQTEARTNTTMLIPGDLVLEMIGIAFRRSKVSAGVDIKPFYDVFVRRNGLWDLPVDDRLDQLDCVTLAKSGSRACGEVMGRAITWPSLLGDIKVPLSATAYFLNEEGRHGMVFLDGGDRFQVNTAEAEVKFTPEGGTAMDLDLDDVKWIAFRKPAAPPAVPQGLAYVIGGDTLHLSLLDVRGDVKFRSDFGNQVLSVPVNSVERIEEENRTRILYTTSGSRMSGQFDEHQLTGTLAWSGTPVRFSFAEMRQVAIRRIDYRKNQEAREIDLAKSLKTSDPRLVRIATLLDTSDVHAAGPLLDKLLDDRQYNALAREKKDQLRFLQGEYLLKSGQYDEAASVFKKLRRAKVDNVLWHSRARLAMLERYGDGKYDQADISRPDVFDRAARSLATEFRLEAAHGLDGIEKSEPDSRGEYLKLKRRAGQLEETLQIANRLTGGESDEYLLHLWRVTTRLHQLEGRRLTEQLAELQEQPGRSARGPGGRTLSESQRRRIEQKIAQIERDIEKAAEGIEALGVKIRQAGFIIDDPDLIDAGDE
ncbi:MAG: tetratricopeptide repeat-containing serine protease family protein [Phycisphaerae bacterium]